MTKNHNRSEITIDLGLEESWRGLMALHQLVDKKRKIISASLHSTKTKIWQNENEFADAKETNVSTMLVAAFGVLSGMPNLQHLIVKLDQNIPAQALTVLFQGAPKLKVLRLQQVTVTGCVTQLRELERVVQKHSALTDLKMFDCKGVSSIQALLIYLPSLAEVEMVATEMSRANASADSCLLQVLCKPTLRVLKLHEIPDLKDQDIRNLVMEMTLLPAEMFQCRDLRLSSSDMLGKRAGEAIAELMLANTSIERLSLHLAGDWKSCGSQFVEVLKCNKHLKDLGLRLNGKTHLSITNQAIEIAKALEEPSAVLESLNLCVQSVMDNASDDMQDSLVNALESLVECNHVLHRISIYDDSVYWCQNLLDCVDAKLKLNASGLSRLLYHPETIQTNVNYDRDYVNAMAKGSQNLDLLFFALSAHPDLCSLKNGPNLYHKAVEDRQVSPVLGERTRGALFTRGRLQRGHTMRHLLGGSRNPANSISSFLARGAAVFRVPTNNRHRRDPKRTGRNLE